MAAAAASPAIIRLAAAVDSGARKPPSVASLDRPDPAGSKRKRLNKREREGVQASVMETRYNLKSPGE